MNTTTMHIDAPSYHERFDREHGEVASSGLSLAVSSISDHTNIGMKQEFDDEHCPNHDRFDRYVIMYGTASCDMQQLIVQQTTYAELAEADDTIHFGAKISDDNTLIPENCQIVTTAPLPPPSSPHFTDLNATENPYFQPPSGSSSSSTVCSNLNREVMTQHDISSTSIQHAEFGGKMNVEFSGKERYTSDGMSFLAEDQRKECEVSSTTPCHNMPHSSSNAVYPWMKLSAACSNPGKTHTRIYTIYSLLFSAIEILSQVQLS